MNEDLIELFKTNSDMAERITDTLPAAIYITDAEGRFLYLNAAAAELAGDEQDSDKGMDRLKLFYPNGSPVPQEKIPMVVALKEERRIKGTEVIAEYPNGDRIWLDVHSSPIYNEGELTGGIHMLVDISAKKKSEARLLSEFTESEHQKRLYEAIISSTPDLVYVFDLNYRFTFVNDALLEMWGRTWEESIGKTLREVGYEPWHAELHEREIDQVIETREPVQGEVAFPHDKLGQRIYDYIFVPVLNDRGEVEAVAGTTRDVTERKKAEQDLRKSEEKYRTLVENFPNGAVALFDKDLRYQVVGGSIFEETAFSAEEIVGQKISDRYPEELYLQVEPYFRSALEGEAGSLEVEYHDRRWIAHLMPVRDEEGEVYAGMIMVQNITDLKRMEQELRESEAKFRMIAENLNEIVWMASSDGEEFIYINPAFEDLWNLDREKVYDDPLVFLEAIHPDDRERVRREFAAITDREFDEEYRILQPGGGYRWIHSRGNRVHDEDGNITRIIGIGEDITERKEAEQKLRKSRNRLRTAFEIETVGILFWGGDNFTITEVNDAFLDMCGYSREEVLGMNWRELTPEEFYPVSQKAVGDLKTIGHTEPYEKQYIRKDGSRWWGLSAPRRIDDNEVVEYLVDITELKKSEEEREQLLREVKTERERLLEIFKHAPSFMCVQRGPDHVYERANDLYRQLIGDRDIIGRPVREVLPDLEGQGYFELLDRVYETGESFIGTDMKVVLHQHPDSDREPEVRYIDFVYQPLRGADGSVNGIFTQGVDLTERRKVKAELEAMNETLEERVEERTASLVSYQKQLRSLASRLSKAEEQERQRLAAELHDNLGQMLAVGKMKVDLLQKNHLPGEAASEVEELKEVMEDALTYTRDLMTDLKPPPSLDEEDLLAKIEWLAKKMEKHDLTVVIDDDTRPKPLSKEIQTTLLQCVRELLFNVLRHTTVDKAHVSLKRNNGQIIVTVEDEGDGFETDDISGPADKGGFGLFNIRERIDMIGGEVDIRSEPGTGTRARLCIPLKAKDMKAELPEQPESETETPEQEAPAKAGKTEKIRILLADDHQMVREGLRKIIEEEDGMAVIGEAADGEEAIELTRTMSPDVILMDVNMPKMDGIEATRRILSEKPRIRVIGLSLHDDEAVIRDMRNVGATAYLTKNEAFESLIASIRAEASTPPV